MSSSRQSRLIRVTKCGLLDLFLKTNKYVISTLKFKHLYNYEYNIVRIETRDMGKDRHMKTPLMNGMIRLYRLLDSEQNKLHIVLVIKTAIRQINS